MKVVSTVVKPYPYPEANPTKGVYVDAYKDGWIDINILKRRFMELYNRLGLRLNSRFLNRDIEDIEERLEVWSRLYNLNNFELNLLYEYTRDVIRSDEKRNFFAHSGLGRTMVDVKIGDGKWYIRYADKIFKKNKKVKEVVDQWITKPD